MADIIIEKLYQMPAFTWGRKLQRKDVQIRNLYLDAIKLADNGDFSALLKFARS
jgi:hypothetical protein